MARLTKGVHVQVVYICQIASSYIKVNLNSPLLIYLNYIPIFWKVKRCEILKYLKETILYIKKACREVIPTGNISISLRTSL